MIRKIVCGCTVFVVSGVAVAQGAFDFDDIPGVDQRPAVTLDVSPIMVGWIRTALQGVDPEGAELLRGLRSVKVRVYHSGDNARQFSSFIDDVTDELQGSGWESVMSAEDEGSIVRWYMRMTEEEVSGMTVMAADGSEAIFINIDGTISAEDLGRVLAHVGAGEMLGAVRLPPPAPAPAIQPTAE